MTNGSSCHSPIIERAQNAQLLLAQFAWYFLDNTSSEKIHVWRLRNLLALQRNGNTMQINTEPCSCDGVRVGQSCPLIFQYCQRTRAAQALALNGRPWETRKFHFWGTKARVLPHKEQDNVWHQVVNDAESVFQALTLVPNGYRKGHPQRMTSLKIELVLTN